MGWRASFPYSPVDCAEESVIEWIGKQLSYTYSTHSFYTASGGGYAWSPDVPSHVQSLNCLLPVVPVVVDGPEAVLLCPIPNSILTLISGSSPTPPHLFIIKEI